MFKLPDFKGRDIAYVESSLKFLTYHAEQTLSGKEQRTALASIHTEAVKWDINLDEDKEVCKYEKR
jgi:hypothetical protein